MNLKEKIEKVIMRVQKPARYIGGELNSVIKDKEKIDALLNKEDYQIKQAPGKHTSIGIRNVNKRIRLVYGEEYGLTIDQNDELVTTSRITIPYHNENTSAKERSVVEQELKLMGRKIVK